MTASQPTATVDGVAPIGGDAIDVSAHQSANVGDCGIVACGPVAVTCRGER